MSENNKLLLALSDFQNEVPIIHKGKEGHKYTYADLATILPIINPILKKHGLGYYQLVTDEGLKTTVYHIESGQSIESTIKIETGITLSGMNAFQVLGSAITYLRRYALSAMLGLVTDKDIDATGKKKDEPDENQLEVWATQIKNCKTVEALEAYWKQNIDVVKGEKAIVKLFTDHKKTLTNV